MGVATKSSRGATPRKSFGATLTNAKPVKANTSILSFFKKSENKEGSLFLGAEVTAETHTQRVSQYNEVEWPRKKRRINDEKGDVSVASAEPAEDVKVETEAVDATLNPSPPAPTAKPRISAPFMVDPDSDEESEQETKDLEFPTLPPVHPPSRPDTPPNLPISFSHKVEEHTKVEASIDPDSHGGVPTLKQEDSVYDSFDQLGEFAEFEDDLELDGYEGEEAREMRFMKEQARLEADELQHVLDEDDPDDGPNHSGKAQHCPVCDGSLAGISTDAATRHVNACLDGDPTPLSPVQDSHPVKVDLSVEAPTVESELISKRFARAAVPRPGQQNPLELTPVTTGPKSAFSKLMSNNAEDSAWATAAAAEKESRGRPAYERTCPFYKIMPGFSICVDAFRYGAVEGCKAYFLSHFHSDHYIGLTANWRHGPIFCSKVTGSLVKQQLRTAAKWVVELEFDKPYDVPGTGASVTMISANHCPGSSLFLFSKPDRAEGDPCGGRTKRILHCGDFRACPAHTTHNLLRPDVLDAVSGKTRQQKIDICYLDTTYLNPRYSFPPQGDVIQACADLCSSMSPDPDCKDDIWERSAKALGTPAVSKYFAAVKSEEGHKQAAQKKRPRQRLLVICGTYSIGKERICVGIAKALKSKIFASPGKIKICKQLGDPELSELLTSDPLEAQVHMQMLMEIRAETLQEYLNSYKPHFSRILGFRPSGWNFRPTNGKAVGANTPPSTIQTQTILHTKSWRTRFGYKDFIAQRGSTKEAMCFGVPYSEHSSFRELAMFVMSLRIDKIIPTVNVGSEPSRKRMKAWLDRWQAERRRGGLLRALIEGEDDEGDPGVELWGGKDGEGGGAWW